MNLVVQELRQRTLGRSAPSWANRAANEIERLEREHADLREALAWALGVMRREASLMDFDETDVIAHANASELLTKAGGQQS